MGDVTGDMAARRGLISGTNSLADDRVEITALLPQAELTSYQTALKSMTAGEGTYSLELSHHEAVPPEQQRELRAAYKREDRESAH